MEFESHPSSKSLTIEDALERTGTGWASISLSILVLFISSLDSSEFKTLGVLKTTATDENVRELSVETLAAALTVGQIVSLFVTMLMTDKVGRRVFILVGLGITALADFITALSWGFGMNLSTRFLAGLGTGLASLTAFHLLAECLGSKWRSRLLVVVATGALTLGPAIVDLISAVVGWRQLQMVLATLTLILLVIAYYSMLESPRVLVNMRKCAEASDVCRKIAASNGVTNLQISSVSEKQSLVENGSLKDLFSASLWPASRLLIILYLLAGFSSAKIVTRQQDDDELGRLVSQLVGAVIACVFSYFADPRTKSTIASWLYVVSSVCLTFVLILQRLQSQGTILLMGLSNLFLFIGLAFNLAYTVELVSTEIRGSAHSLLLIIFKVSCLSSIFLEVKSEDIVLVAILLLMAISSALLPAVQSDSLDALSRSFKLNWSLDEADEEAHLLALR
jgi:MFS family permease